MPEAVEEGRSIQGWIFLVVFRLTMAVVIALFAWRTYEEVAIARARSSGTLERADATVVKVTEERKQSLGGAGQDRSAEAEVFWTEVTLELRVHGEVQSTRGGGGRVLAEGDHTQVGLWHGHVIEIEGDYVWQGWHSGPGANILLASYPLAMGYVIALTASTRIRLARRHGANAPDPADFFLEKTSGVVVGLATLVPLILLPAALHTEHPRFWPLVPTTTGTTAALLLIRKGLRRHGRNHGLKGKAHQPG